MCHAIHDIYDTSQTSYPLYYLTKALRKKYPYMPIIFRKPQGIVPGLINLALEDKIIRSACHDNKQSQNGIIYLTIVSSTTGLSIFSHRQWTFYSEAIRSAKTDCLPTE